MPSLLGTSATRHKPFQFSYLTPEKAQGSSRPDLAGARTVLTADFGMNKACNAPSEAKQQFASPSQPTSPGQLLLCLLYKQVNRGAHRFCSLNPGYTASHRQSWDLDQGFFTNARCILPSITASEMSCALAAGEDGCSSAMTWLVPS